MQDSLLVMEECKITWILWNAGFMFLFFSLHYTERKLKNKKGGG